MFKNLLKLIPALILIFMAFQQPLLADDSEIVEFPEAGIQVNVIDTVAWKWDFYTEQGDKSLAIYSQDKYFIMGIGIAGIDDLKVATEQAQEIFVESVGEVEFDWININFNNMQAMKAEVEFLSQNEPFTALIIVFETPEGKVLQIGVLGPKALEGYDDDINNILSSIKPIEK